MAFAEAARLSQSRRGGQATGMNHGEADVSRHEVEDVALADLTIRLAQGWPPPGLVGG